MTDVQAKDDVGGRLQQADAAAEQQTGWSFMDLSAARMIFAISGNPEPRGDAPRPKQRARFVAPAILPVRDHERDNLAGGWKTTLFPFPTLSAALAIFSRDRTLDEL